METLKTLDRGIVAELLADARDTLADAPQWPCGAGRPAPRGRAAGWMPDRLQQAGIAAAWQAMISTDRRTRPPR